MVSLSFCLLLIGQSLVSHPEPPIQRGWHDDFHVHSHWQSLDIQNKATVKLGSRGNLQLSLGHVPASWPYAYQWSGLKQNLQADIAHFPVLVASVGKIHGYAHLDIDVLDAAGKAVKTIRSSVLNVNANRSERRFPGMGSAGSNLRDIDSGLLVADLSKELLPATYSFQIRLIVGGDNIGCTATYHWIAFLGQKEFERFTSQFGPTL